MTPPLGKLEYLYLGTADFDRDCAYYETVLGAEKVWAFHAFGAKVAAFRVCVGPHFLLADHRPAPSCMPVLAVADLAATVAALQANGWQSIGEVFEIPNGPGWKWSEHVQRVAGTPSCQVEHVGLVLSGRAKVRMDDGTEVDLGPGDLFYVAPGHDSWVVGEEPYVSLHFLGADQYAR